jgi:hypothetical protein
MSCLPDHRIFTLGDFPMQLYSVSINEIEIDLIHFFKTTFAEDTAPIFPGSDVKKRYRYTPESWAQLADDLSTLPWMIQLGVVLIQDDMRGVATIAQLAGLVFKHIRHVVAPKNRLEVIPLTTLMRSSATIQASTASRSALAIAGSSPAKKSKKKKKSDTK